MREGREKEMPFIKNVNKIFNKAQCDFITLFDGFILIKPDIYCRLDSVCCSALLSTRPHVACSALYKKKKKDICITFPV